MPDIQEIEAIIFAAIDDLNALHPAEKHLEKSLDTILFGKGSTADSLDLVNLIVSVEAGLADRFGAAVAIADEKAFSRKSSPFKTVRSLADYAKELLDEAQQ